MFLVTVTGPVPQAVAEQPNIVFFFVDDMGWQDTSEPFHSEPTRLNERYETPAMERLADQGLKFTQAYAAAICSPSRASLMTGQNAARHRVTNWILRKDTSPDTEHPELEPPRWNMNGLSPGPGLQHTVIAKTLPMYLKDAGYRTIHVGKAHWSAVETPGDDPLQLGFDIKIADNKAGQPGSYWGTRDFSAAWRGKAHTWDVPDLDAYHGRDIYLTEAMTIEALKAVDQAVADGVPFYLYMSHYAIHAPFEEDLRFHDRFVQKGLDEFDSRYASMIAGMDKSLGDVMAHLAHRGIADNTVIFFMTDNGQHKMAARNLPLRGHKRTPYEGGIRVPAMVKWPGVTQPGAVSTTPIIIEDIFPTILEVAGVRDYESPDGRSFVPQLRGESVDVSDRALVWHYPHTRDQDAYSAIRRGDWKLIYWHVDQSFELFDLAADIGEHDNLAEEHRKLVQDLARTLAAALVARDAQMPILKSTGEAVPLPGRATSKTREST
jgi:arylsulfatase A-like enzyme